MIRNGEHHRVDVVSRHHLAVVMVGFTVGVAIVLVDGVHGLLQRAFVQVARGHDLTIVLGHEAIRVGRAHHAPTDDADDNALGGRGVSVFAQSARGNNCRRSDRRGSGSDKTAPGDFRA